MSYTSLPAGDSIHTSNSFVLWSSSHVMKWIISKYIRQDLLLSPFAKHTRALARASERSIVRFEVIPLTYAARGEDIPTVRSRELHLPNPPKHSFNPCYTREALEYSKKKYYNPIVMSRIVEIGPYHSIDPSQWGENYSERRHLDRMEYEMLQISGFGFSFEIHIKRLIRRFSNSPVLRIFDGGCGEGSALIDFRKIAERLSVKLETTGVTRNPRHKDILAGCGVDEVVIGSVENFFETDGRKNYYHFILDYQGALSYDEPRGIQGAYVVPIYSRILEPGGSALLVSPPVFPGWLKRNNLKIIQGSEEKGPVLVEKV